MFRHINSHRCDFLVVLQGLFAGQLKTTVGSENIFDPMNGAANTAFIALIVVGDGLHRHVFPIVFEGDQEFITDAQVIRFAASFVQFGVGSVQDVEHGLEDRFGRSDSAFEFFV